MDSNEFLLKLGDGEVSEVFTTVAGCQELDISIGGEPIVNTSKENDGWQSILAGAGGKSIEVSFNGTAKDEATLNTLQDIAIAKTINNFQICKSASGRIIECGFALQINEQAGTDQDVKFSGTLRSSGQPTIT